MPYKPEEYPKEREYICDGSHSSKILFYAAPLEEADKKGALEIEVCNDPCCAKVFARCICQDNKWEEGGTLLTCQLCGGDST